MPEHELQPVATRPSRSQIRQMLASLPHIRTDLNRDEIIQRVKRLSKRGKLPGFEPNPSDGFFEAIAFGNPFDYRLIASHHPGQIRFTAKIKPKMPTIFWIVTALTIWPGVLFTDSLLNTWFGWYPNETWVTYAWYLPMTILPLPWLHRSIMAKTRAAALVHAHEQIATIAKALGGSIEE
ncbi:MAG TPA: hypothetical protein ENJ00_11975 [Phycisphaerales bacterium]|nr:hypothetical protein [Phycisphaerales bacterium]